MINMVLGKLLPNLKVVSASKQVVGLNEAAYSADVSTGIISTEHILGPLRGSWSVYLGYKEDTGDKVFEGFFPEKIRKEIMNTKGISITESAKDLTTTIKNLVQNPDLRPSPVILPGKSADRILNKIFE